MSARQHVVLFAPAITRHEPLPDATSSAHVLAVKTGGVQAGANTVIIPASLIPASKAALHPTFLLKPDRRTGWLPYTLMSYTGLDLLYVRLPGPAVHGTPASDNDRARWVSDLSARHRAHGQQLNNHFCWFRNLLPGLEAEHKFTLSADTDIWGLATTTHQRIQAGAIDGWICEHGNNGGFGQWDFTNHLFAITQPASERGYIAFMPAFEGNGYRIRRKRYARDQILRREEVTDDPSLTADPADLHQVIHDRYELTPAWAATYRRVRYNVLLESLRTGHVFSIMYDRCTTADNAVLVQTEVEYVRSRTLQGSSRGQILRQLSHLTDWTRELLTSLGITADENHLSKLTWLYTQSPQAGGHRYDSNRKENATRELRRQPVGMCS